MAGLCCCQGRIKCEMSFQVLPPSLSPENEQKCRVTFLELFRVLHFSVIVEVNFDEVETALKG